MDSFAFYAIVIVLVAYFKVLPFYFHLRAAWTAVNAARGGRFTSLDEEAVITDIVWPCDMDWNLHMNNSIYYLMADHGRIAWLAKFLRKPLRTLRTIRIANGGVQMFFLREMGLLQRFELSTRLLGCDSKWVYFRQEFRSSGKIFAVGTAKFVFKQKNGKTISPQEMVEKMGFTLTPLLAAPSKAGELLSGLLTQLQPDAVPATPASNK